VLCSLQIQIDSTIASIERKSLWKNGGALMLCGISVCLLKQSAGIIWGFLKKLNAVLNPLYIIGIIKVESTLFCEYNFCNDILYELSLFIIIFVFIKENGLEAGSNDLDVFVEFCSDKTLFVVLISWDELNI